MKGEAMKKSESKLLASVCRARKLGGADHQKNRV
jgi:hypothetical protein